MDNLAEIILLNHLWRLRLDSAVLCCIKGHKSLVMLITCVDVVEVLLHLSLGAALGL